MTHEGSLFQHKGNNYIKPHDKLFVMKVLISIN